MEIENKGSHYMEIESKGSHYFPEKKNNKSLNIVSKMRKSIKSSPQVQTFE